MSALSEMLTAANTDGLSYMEIERRAEAAGLKLSHGTAHVYMTGRHGQVSRQYLEAFVAVFPSLRLDKLMRAAELPPDLGPYVAPEAASALSGPEREALDTIIKSMAAGKTSRRNGKPDEPPTSGPVPIRSPRPKSAGPGDGQVIEEGPEDEQIAAYDSPEPAGQPEQDPP